MMYLLNIIDDIASSDALLSVLVIILIIVSLITFYLMYAQNKEITRQINNAKKDNEISKEKKHISFMEEIVQSDMNDSEKINDMESMDNSALLNSEVEEDSTDSSFSSSLIETVSGYDDDLDLQNNDIIKKDDFEKNLHQDIKLESKEYDNNEFNLNNVTKELESVSKEKTIELTPYETLQEETAIISYDELVRQSDLTKSNYINESELGDTLEEQNMSDISSYEHEEAFLEALKQLQQILN